MSDYDNNRENQGYDYEKYRLDMELTANVFFIYGLKDPVSCFIELGDYILDANDVDNPDYDVDRSVKETRSYGCDKIEFPDGSILYLRTMKNSRYPEFFHSYQEDTLKEIYNEKKGDLK